MAGCCHQPSPSHRWPYSVQLSYPVTRSLPPPNTRFRAVSLNRHPTPTAPAATEAMARGHQKIQSQQKNLQRKKEADKAKGSDQKSAAQKALTHKCAVCMTLMPDPKTYKQHFESKHPKAELPAELKELVA